MIPDRITIRIASIESFREGMGFWERPVRGFDFSSAASSFDHTAMIAARKLGWGDFLAEEQLLYDLDFARLEGPPDFVRRLTFNAKRDGVLHGFVGFWQAMSRGTIFLRCEPGDFHDNWAPSLFRLPKGFAVRAGDRIDLTFLRKDRPGWQWRWEARVSTR